MKVRITFELDDSNPLDKAIINYISTWGTKKKGVVVHELLRRCVEKLCVEDIEWRALYCEAINVRVIEA